MDYQWSLFNSPNNSETSRYNQPNSVQPNNYGSNQMPNSFNRYEPPASQNMFNSNYPSPIARPQSQHQTAQQNSFGGGISSSTYFNPNSTNYPQGYNVSNSQRPQVPQMPPSYYPTSNQHASTYGQTPSPGMNMGNMPGNYNMSNNYNMPQQQQNYNYNQMPQPPQQAHNANPNTFNSDSFPPISTFKMGTFSSNSAPSSNGFSNSNSGTGTWNSMSSNNFSGNQAQNVFQNHNDSANSQDSRETGIIEKLLQSYGFIQCCERQARLFFHFSEFHGKTDHLRIGDPVEFEVSFDKRTGKPIASTVSKISPDVVLSEERVIGVVTTELKKNENGSEQHGRISYENRGECFFLPYCKEDVEGYVTLKPGDKVSFQIATNQRNGNLASSHVRLEDAVEPVKYQGVVSAVKDSYGFIERADVVDEIFFNFSELKNSSALKLGDHVQFIIQTIGGKEVATDIMKLPEGTVVFEDIDPNEMRGQVLKPVEKGSEVEEKDPLTGRIRYRGEDRSEVEVKFGERDQVGDFTLKHGDWVKFNIATDRRDKLHKATKISLLDESFNVSGEKREHGVINSLKEGFGYIECVERSPAMLFRYSEVLDPQKEISVGEEVEFTAVCDQNSTPPNRTSFCAIRVRRVPAGTVQFEYLVHEGLEGKVIREVKLSTKTDSWNELLKNDSVVETGLISYEMNGDKHVMDFSKQNGVDLPQFGDRVKFNVYIVKKTREPTAKDIKILPGLPSVTPIAMSMSRSTFAGSGRTSFDRNNLGPIVSQQDLQSEHVESVGNLGVSQGSRMQNSYGNNQNMVMNGPNMPRGDQNFQIPHFKNEEIPKNTQGIPRNSSFGSQHLTKSLPIQNQEQNHSLFSNSLQDLLLSDLCSKFQNNSLESSKRNSLGENYDPTNFSYGLKKNLKSIHDQEIKNLNRSLSGPGFGNGGGLSEAGLGDGSSLSRPGLSDVRGLSGVEHSDRSNFSLSNYLLEGLTSNCNSNSDKSLFSTENIFGKDKIKNEAKLSNAEKNAHFALDDKNAHFALNDILNDDVAGEDTGDYDSLLKQLGFDTKDVQNREIKPKNSRNQEIKSENFGSEFFPIINDTPDLINFDTDNRESTRRNSESFDEDAFFEQFGTKPENIRIPQNNFEERNENFEKLSNSEKKSDTIRADFGTNIIDFDFSDPDFDNRPGYELGRSDFRARNQHSIPLHQGFIATLKESFGFIETASRDKELFFHYSNFDGDVSDLDLGQEVEYTITRNGPNNKMSAENVHILPVGSIQTPKVLGKVYEGTVLRSMRSMGMDPDQQEYCGLVCVGKPEDKFGKHQFGITGLESRKELLQVGDQVSFQLDEDGWAVNVRAVRKKVIATVEAVKGPYGFLCYDLDDKKRLFFHETEVKDGVILEPGDEVEFFVFTNKKTGKSSACNITRIQSGNASAQRNKRPERLISKLKDMTNTTNKVRVQVVRQPRGPDGTNGFKKTQ